MQRHIVRALGWIMAASAGLAYAGQGAAPEPRREKRVVKIVEREAGDAAQAEGEAPRVRRRIALREAIGAGGFLGVHLTEVGRDDVARLGLDAERGARVSDVSDDSPAAKAGLQENDVVVAWQGEAVHSALQLRRLVRETPPGRSVTVEVLRQGRRETMTVEVGGRRSVAGLPHDMLLDLPEGPGDVEELERAARGGPAHDLLFDLRTHPGDDDDDAQPRRFVWRGPARERLEALPGLPPRRLGLRFQEIDGQLARYFRLPAGRDQALLVSAVDEDSPASRAGLRAGDVLLEFGGQKIDAAADLHRALGRSEDGQSEKLLVWRDGKALELRVTLGSGARQALNRSTTRR